MDDIFARNKLIYGENYLNQLQSKHVMIVGLGGVGGFALEALARAGVKNFTIIDFDTVSISNINRQLIALTSTVGQSKSLLFEKRLKEINPDINIRVIDTFFSKENNEKFFDKEVDYIVDAIDTMSSKITLLTFAVQNKIPVVTSLGAGNRKDPTQLFVADISEINNLKDNFAKNIIRQLNKNGITTGITAVCSNERPIKSSQKTIETSVDNSVIKKREVGSTPFVPAVAGYYMGYVVLNELLDGCR